jgi:hypothetical protein
VTGVSNATKGANGRKTYNRFNLSMVLPLVVVVVVVGKEGEEEERVEGSWTDMAREMSVVQTPCQWRWIRRLIGRVLGVCKDILRH